MSWLNSTHRSGNQVSLEMHRTNTKLWTWRGTHFLLKLLQLTEPTFAGSSYWGEDDLNVGCRSDLGGFCSPKQWGESKAPPDSFPPQIHPHSAQKYSWVKRHPFQNTLKNISSGIKEASTYCFIVKMAMAMQEKVHSKVPMLSWEDSSHVQRHLLLW